MKKLITVICILFGLILFPATAAADSPLTSTKFSNAYKDISIVKEACEKQVINADIADYLSDPQNPIDIKAAVINALYGENNKKANAEAYCRQIYNQSIEQLDRKALRGDQLFCIGYLLSMDEYENPEQALPYLRLAEQKINDSFTVSVVRAITESMNFDKSPWEYIEPLLQNKNLTMDMRQEAVNIILDYMASYSDTDELKVSKNHIMIRNEKSQTIYLYGTLTVSDQCPYEITESSDIAYTSLARDSYGIYYIMITGIKNGSSSVLIENSDGKKAVVHFDVVSKNVYNKLTNTLALYIGADSAYVGKTKSTLINRETPFLKNNHEFIPAEFCTKAFGASCQFDSKSGIFKITYGHRSIIIKSGSKTASVNGTAYNLAAKPIVRNDICFITLQDFTNLLNKKYSYLNGLIFITDKVIKTDIVNDDYILQEISSLITKENTQIHEPTAFLKNGKYGFKDYTGNIIVKTRFNKAYDFSNGMAVVSVIDSAGEEKYGYIDGKGNYVIKPEYKGAYSFSGGLAPVLNEKGTLWGYIDRNGRLVIPYRYTNCRSFRDGYAAVQTGDKWGYIDRNGNFTIQPVYDNAGSFLDGLAVVKQSSSEYSINTSGMAVFTYENGDIFTGEVMDGIPNGKGVYTWINGMQYIGEFLDGKITGKGVRTDIDGTVTEGFWKDGNYQGN